MLNNSNRATITITIIELPNINAQLVRQTGISHRMIGQFVISCKRYTHRIEINQKKKQTEMKPANECFSNMFIVQ